MVFDPADFIHQVFKDRFGRLDGREVEGMQTENYRELLEEMDGKLKKICNELAYIMDELHSIRNAMESGTINVDEVSHQLQKVVQGLIP